MFDRLKKWAKGLTLALGLSVGLGGCAGLMAVYDSLDDGNADPGDYAYAMAAVFNEVDAEALILAQSADTPPEVKRVLKTMRGVARVAMPIVQEAMEVYAKAKAQWVLNPDTNTLQKMTLAGLALQDQLDTFGPAVNAFVKYVNSL